MIMSSTLIPVPKQVWTQITTTDKVGSIRHHRGNSLVVYVESPLNPNTFDSSVATMEVTDKGDSWTYFGVSASDFIWAYSISEDCNVVVSPAEV